MEIRYLSIHRGVRDTSVVVLTKKKPFEFHHEVIFKAYNVVCKYLFAVWRRNNIENFRRFPSIKLGRKKYTYLRIPTFHE